MEITGVRIKRVRKEGKMKAIVSITFDNEFVVHEIKVIEGYKGLFIVMPSRKIISGEFKDIAHPISSAAKERIQNAVLQAFNSAQFVEEAAASMEQDYIGNR